MRAAVFQVGSIGPCVHSNITPPKGSALSKLAQTVTFKLTQREILRTLAYALKEGVLAETGDPRGRFQFGFRGRDHL